MTLRGLARSVQLQTVTALLAIVASTPTVHAVRMQDRPPSFEPTLVGTFSGDVSDAFGVNRHGDLVGTGLLPTGEQRGFILKIQSRR